MTSSDSALLCPSCSGENSPDSKFCRHCGQALDGATMNSAPAALSSDLDLPEEMLPSVAFPAAEGAKTEAPGEDEEALSSPGEIDGRRARQLLERAHGLSDRGDTAGAILACRQAIALAPTLAGGHSMLGTLLEGNGDLVHAAQAFEKAAELEPTSMAMRDVERLRDKTSAKPAAPLFHFDDAELFGDDNIPTKQEEIAPSAAATGTAETIAISDVSSTEANPLAAPGLEIMTPVAESAANEVAAPSEDSDALPVGIAAAIPPVRERRVANVPVRVERRVNASSAVSPLSTPVGARVQGSTPQVPIAAAPVINPITFAGTDTTPQGWSAMWARPSYFARSLPLIGATVLSLGFLSWARGLADARNLASPPSPVVASLPATNPPAASEAPAVVSAPAPGNSNLPALAPVGGQTASSGGFPISNQRGGSAASTPPTTAQNNSPNSGEQNAAPPRPATGRVATARPSSSNERRNVNAQRSAARSPQLLAPAPIPAPGSSRPAPPTGGAGRRGAGDLVLPPPVISQPAPAPPATSVLPAGGAPALNPAGASGRGYVRITQGRVGSSLPLRSSARAGDAERSAAAAARSGSTTQAIDGLTAAINANSSDAGFRYQQRATLFLQQGDYSRAADDFQAAISAYNNQIERGEQVASARAGLRAARSGLNLALAGGR